MRRSRRSILVTAIVLAVALAGVGGFLALYDSTSSTRVAGGGTKTVAVALVDAPVGFDVTPDIVTVDPGTRLVLEVVNKAGEVHDLAVRNGPHTRMLNPGQSQRLDLGLVTSRLDAWCTIPGHKTGGMTLDLRVAGSSAASTPAAWQAGVSAVRAAGGDASAM
jgi:nitrite reductase (NO-forming)